MRDSGRESRLTTEITEGTEISDTRPAPAPGTFVTSVLSVVSLFLMWFCTLAGPLAAQAGDAKDAAGTVQKPLPADLAVPPAPVLTPEQGLQSIRVQPGFRVELVAAEPLVEDPIAITFDPRGRMWVVEMRGFMPNVDGTGEELPNGRIVVLEDTDHDGRMDHSSVFLDGLVLPRLVGLVRGGVLVLTPPELRWYQDTDGDGKGDRYEVLASGFTNGLDNPEHECNSPLYGLDNWIYFARYAKRLRYRDGRWEWQVVRAGGQWGLSQDDFGRLYFNSNSAWLFAHLVPPHYARRNPNLRGAGASNVNLARDREVHPIRITPGVNRGYRDGVLRPDFSLKTVTAVCGVEVFRGEQLGPDAYGDVFVCEPAGHVVRRFELHADDEQLRARNVYDQAEFLASTDERFRPVNVTTGPDGALYVVDMYRGLIQHRNFVTTYLRRQVVDRGLAAPLGLGRIYRVVADSVPATRAIAATSLDRSSKELVELLRDRNGWVRSTSQRLLVERGDARAVPALRALARDEAPLARLHALWTLDGLDALDRDSIARALRSSDPTVQVAAVRLSEPRLRREEVDSILLGVLAGMTDGASSQVRLQLALTLGEVSRVDAAMRDVAEAELAKLAWNRSDKWLGHAILSGLGGRELDFALRLLQNPAESSKGRVAMLGELAGCVVRERQPIRIAELLRVIAEESGWQQLALLEGLIDALPKPGTRKLSFPTKPAALAKLEALDAAISSRVPRILESIEWAEEGVPTAAARPLTADEQSRFDLGKTLYSKECASCHQFHGMGMTAIAPPLRESQWVLGDEARLLRILLNGLVGPIEVAGQNYTGYPLMPDHSRLADDELAAIATYVRRAWDHEAEPVDVSRVRTLRERYRGRGEPWTAAELLRPGR